MMKNKILFVCYDGYRTTNARVRCYRFAKELKKSGIKADVFSFKDHLNASYDGFESHKVNVFEKLSLLIRATNKLLKEKKSTVFYVQKAGYFAIAPLLVHFVKGNKLVLDYDDYEYEESFISRILFRTLAKRSVFCVGASHYLQRLLARFNKESYYIPTGVDLDVFKKTKVKKKKDKIVFSWIGIIVDREALENVMFIVKSFDDLTKKYKNIELEIVGGGKNIENIKRSLAQINNPSIKYLGKLPPDKIPEYLSGVDVGLFVLLKNTKYNQSKSPTKLFEYMGIGLATISTIVGEPSYVIENNKNGLIADSRQGYINAMEKLIKSKGLIKKLGDGAKHSTKTKYNLEVLGKELANIIKENL